MASDERNRRIRLIRGGPKEFWTAFKNVAIIFSFLVNVVLLIALLIFAGWVMFPLKTGIVEPKLDQLQSAVDALESATIQRTIQIDQQVPVSFTLPLNQNTTVVLSQDVELVRPATFLLPGGAGSINGTVIMNLPTGMELPIVLDMAVPVENNITVQFPVDVSIPLKETELNHVVTRLNDVIIPIRNLIEDLPDGFR